MDNSVGYGAISHNDINGQWKQAIGNSGGEVSTDQATISAISASAGDNCDDSSLPIQQSHASGTLQQLHNEHNINNSTRIGRERGDAVDVLHSSAPSGKSSAGNNNRRGKRKLETDSNAGKSGKHHCCSSSPPSPLFTSETNNRTIASTNHSDHNNHEDMALLEIENSIKLLKSAQKRLSESESYMKSSMDKKLTWMNELRGIIGKLECLETKLPQQCQMTTRSSSGQQENDKECELSNVISPVPPPFPAPDSSTPLESHPPSSKATHWLEGEYMGESEEYNKIKKIVEDASRTCPFITGEISVGDTHVEDRNAAKVCALHSYPVHQAGAMALAAGGNRLLNGCMDVHVQDIIALMTSSYNFPTHDDALDTILKSVVYLEAIPIVADSNIRSHPDKKPYWDNLLAAKNVRMLSAIMTGKVLLKWKNLKLICGFGEEAQLTLQLIWALYPALRCKIYLPHLLEKVPHGQRVLYMWADIEARSLHLHQCDRIAAMLAGSEEPNGVDDVFAHGQVPGFRMRRNDDGTLTAEKQEADGTVYQVISHHDQKVLGTARSVQQLAKWFDCSKAIIRIILHNGKCIKSDDTIIFEIKEVSSDSVECGISRKNMKAFTQLYKKHQLQPRIQLRMVKQEMSQEDMDVLNELCDEFQNTTAGSQIDKRSLGLSTRKKDFFCIKTMSGELVHVSSTKLKALQKLGIYSCHVQDDVVVVRGMDVCLIEPINAEEAHRLGIDQTVKGAVGELESICETIKELLAIKGRSHLVCIKTTSGKVVHVSSSKANALHKLGITENCVKDDVVVVRGIDTCLIESIDVEEALRLGIDQTVKGAEGEFGSICRRIQGLLAIKGHTSSRLVCIKTTSGKVVYVSSSIGNALQKLGGIHPQDHVRDDVVVVRGKKVCLIEPINAEEALRLGIDQTVKGAEGEFGSICRRIQGPLLAIKGHSHLVCIKTTSGKVVHVSSSKANALLKLGITENCVKDDVVVVRGKKVCRIESIDVEEALRLGIDETVEGAEGEFGSICCSLFFQTILKEHTTETLEVMNESVAKKKKITSETMGAIRNQTWALMERMNMLRKSKYSDSQMEKVMSIAETDAQELWRKQHNK